MPSYSPVFSAAFIQYTPSTPNLSYEVPDGYTAVIRQISCRQNIGGWVLDVVIADSISAPALYIYEGEQTGLVNWVGQEGRWVVPGGGLIECNLTTFGSSTSIYVGGYLLRNTLT